MRYHFFLHYGWFFQNLRKEAVQTFMHTTVNLAHNNIMLMKCSIFSHITCRKLQRCFKDHFQKPAFNMTLSMKCFMFLINNYVLSPKMTFTLMGFSVFCNLTRFTMKVLTLIGMRQGGFTPLIIFWLDFVSWIFIKNVQTFEINRDNLTPCQCLIKLAQRWR